MQSRPATEQEHRFIAYAFEHTKLLDRYFLTTRLVGKYARLLQSIGP